MRYTNIYNLNIITLLSVVIFNNCVSKNLPFLIADVCTTQECYETGHSINESLNKSIDPCLDFYNYACDGWISKTKIPNYEFYWDHWQSTAHRLQERLEFLLDYPHEKMAKNLKIVQNLYRECITKRITNKQILKILNTLNGWPLSWFEWNEKRNSWIHLMLNAILKYNVHPLFKIEVKLNMFNTSTYAIYIEPGDIILPEVMLLHPLNYMKEINDYKNWIRNTSTYILKDTRISETYRNQQILDMIEFEMQLATLRNLNDKYEPIRLKDLSKETNFNWKELINNFLKKNRQLNYNDYVVVNGRNYINQLINLLSKSKLRVVANYIIWSIIKDISKYGDDYLQEFNFKIEKSLLDIKEPIPRTRHCVNFITKYLGDFIMPKYIDLYVNDNVIHEIEEMIENIKYQFILILKRNNWLSDNTRELAIEKIDRIKYFIGYPEIKNNDIFENFNFPANSDDNFGDLFRFTEYFALSQFEKIWKNPPSNILPENLFEVNAFYSILQNTIVIPVALLESPFVNIKRPSVYNYGSLGFLIAHEMSHALDNIGRKIDITGNLKKWWSDYDIKKFHTKTECFERQYNNLGINGYHTLSENIADNVGLKISFETFINLNQRNTYALTPYLENFTKKQLFFISFAQLWCEIEPPNFLIYGEVHAPNYKRVFASLRNNPSFNKAFYCPLIEDRCNLW